MRLYTFLFFVFIVFLSGVNRVFADLEAPNKGLSISDCRIIVKYTRNNKGAWVSAVVSEKRKMPREEAKVIIEQGFKFAKSMDQKIKVFYMLDWFTGISGDVRFLQPIGGKVEVVFSDIVGYYSEDELEILFKSVMKN
ncbi:MAG: hypothetical protein ABJQ29_00180 [Luteolibacter sp.]